VSVVDASSTGGITATATLFFSPQLRAVELSGAPATVSWTFQNVAHTVTWDSQPAGAAVADIPATSDGSVARELTVVGEYSYHCSIHPAMTGSILVQ
jgi:plastocyanin